MNHDVLWAALVAAVPSFLAALAAWRSSARTGRRIRTANGLTIGEMVEENSGKLDRLVISFEAHCIDADKRFKSIEERTFTNESLVANLQTSNCLNTEDWG